MIRSQSHFPLEKIRWAFWPLKLKSFCLPVLSEPDFSFECWIITFSLGESNRRSHDNSLRERSRCGGCADLICLDFSSRS